MLVGRYLRSLTVLRGMLAHYQKPSRVVRLAGPSFHEVPRAMCQLINKNMPEEPIMPAAAASQMSAETIFKEVDFITSSENSQATEAVSIPEDTPVSAEIPEPVAAGEPATHTAINEANVEADVAPLSCETMKPETMPDMESLEEKPAESTTASLEDMIDEESIRFQSANIDPLEVADMAPVPDFKDAVDVESRPKTKETPAYDDDDYDPFEVMDLESVSNEDMMKWAWSERNTGKCYSHVPILKPQPVGL